MASENHEKNSKKLDFFCIFCDIFLVDHLIFLSLLKFPLAAFVGEYFPRRPLNISSAADIFLVDHYNISSCCLKKTSCNLLREFQILICT